MFGENLRAARKKRGLTQTELAKQIFVSQQAIWKWESDISTPNPDMIATLSKVLDVSSDDLLGTEGTKNELFGKSEQLDRANEIFNQLTPEGQQQALDYLAFLESKYKK